MIAFRFMVSGVIHIGFRGNIPRIIEIVSTLDWVFKSSKYLIKVFECTTVYIMQNIIFSRHLFSGIVEAYNEQGMRTFRSIWHNSVKWISRKCCHIQNEENNVMNTFVRKTKEKYQFQQKEKITVTEGKHDHGKRTRPVHTSYNLANNNVRTVRLGSVVNSLILAMLWQSKPTSLSMEIHSEQHIYIYTYTHTYIYIHIRIYIYIHIYESIWSSYDRYLGNCS